MENNISRIRTGILKGVALSFKKLVQKKSKENGYLVFSKNGKIYRVKARELLK